MTGPDLILMHPPSVFGFREMPLFFGPVSDVVPSTSVFEIYPIGFLTISDYLTRHGMSVRIVNFALKMLQSFHIFHIADMLRQEGIVVPDQTEGVLLFSTATKHLPGSKWQADGIGSIAARPPYKLTHAPFHHSHAVVVAGVNVSIMD